ncbi:hypothetical protein RJ640_022198 [Escallonia rubra]|uniref:Uncharacterized protein n=1 Tax=Escallonia rubra TaxID=112253 RepID=A0AA88QP46_9ASTE|nr:hypothetical protein RJ640_022198 [Escallonia rubra]
MPTPALSLATFPHPPLAPPPSARPGVASTPSSASSASPSRRTEASPSRTRSGRAPFGFTSAKSAIRSPKHGGSATRRRSRSGRLSCSSSSSISNNNNNNLLSYRLRVEDLNFLEIRALACESPAKVILLDKFHNQSGKKMIKILPEVKILTQVIYHAISCRMWRDM